MRDIKAQDLRIGNIVYSNETGENQVITGLDAENVFFNAVTFDFPEYSDIKPIPLTEEWLIKFGFEVENNKNFTIAFLEKDLKFEIYSENGQTYKIGKYSNGFKHLYYVHELQNLFFSLTNKELEINK